jgi:hypothetical protein
MASMYTNKYLRTNAERGDGNGYTLQTFLAHELKGKAKQYAAKYCRALEKDLESLRGEGEVYRSVSCRGGRAYYPATCPTLESKMAVATAFTGRD